VAPSAARTPRRATVDAAASGESGSSRLRMKIELDPANPRHVVTVRGLGYRLQS
jgi:DNA-binding response OmpR family regulator